MNAPTDRIGRAARWLLAQHRDHARLGPFPADCAPGDVDQAYAVQRAFVAAAARDDLPRAERLHFEGHSLTGGELLDAIGRAAATLGIAPAGGWRRGGMPWPLIRVAGLFVPMLRELSRMAYLWSVPHRLDGARLARTLGPLPATPVDRALAAALQALGHGTRTRAREDDRVGAAAR